MRTIARRIASSVVALGGLSFILMIAAPVSRADGSLSVTFDLIDNMLTVAPGETGVVITGDIVNNSSDPVFTDTASVNIPFADPSSIDLTGFYSTPYPLGPSEDTGDVELFSFNVLPDATPGVYADAGTFTISEFDSDCPTGSCVVGTETFSVDVVGAPEPSALLLMLLGMCAVGSFQLWKNRARITALGH